MVQKLSVKDILILFQKEPYKNTYDIGGFASYGTPANEASKKVAIACGFERFETQYLTKWESVSK